MAVWTTAFINELEDSCFLYVEPGGSKDSSGKTTPRSLRRFPVKGPDGKVDPAHLKNALARIPQADIPDSVKARLTKMAQEMLQHMNGRGDADKKSIDPGGDLIYPGLEYKSRAQAVDAVTPEGIVTAVFSVFDEADDPPEAAGQMPDVIHDGAFAETLVERAGRIDLLHNHNWKSVCGKHIEIWEEPAIGGMAKSQYNLNTFWGNETFQLIKAGDLAAYSFGFLRRRNSPEKKSWEVIDGRRHLYRLHLFELGPTPNAIAVHPAARVIEAKSAGGVLLTDMHLPDLLQQAENVLAALVAEGEQLLERRLELGRKSLSAEAMQNIEESAVRMDELGKRLLALATPPAESGDATPAHRSDREVKSFMLRADLARARLRELGITTE